VLLTLQFRGKQILGLESHADANAINKTVIFNAFVFCQIFNEVNARKLEERNVFKGIFAGWLFSAIVLASIVFQIIIVQLLNKFASTVPLEGKYWAISVLIGFVSWPLVFLVKFIPVPKKPILVMKSIRRSKKKKQNLAAAAAAASAESGRKSN
jgi:Ca2+-transporting ATPase